MNMMLSQTAGSNTEVSTQQSCSRCRGYMEHEMCIDLESDSGRSTCWVLRCIQCGDIVDEVILQNRSSFSHEGVLVASA
jgi:hypothetical protein